MRYVPMLLVAIVGCTKGAGDPPPKIVIPAPRFVVKDIVQPKTDAQRLVRKEIIEGYGSPFLADDRIRGIVFEKYGPDVAYANYFAMADAAKIPRKSIDSYKYRPESKDSITLVRVKGSVDHGGIESRPFDNVWEVRNVKTAKIVGQGSDKWLPEYLAKLPSMAPVVPPPPTETLDGD